ncbi:hypothetical protein ABTX61_34430, partial [Amycolatopsis japonica]
MVAEATTRNAHTSAKPAFRPLNAVVAHLNPERVSMPDIDIDFDDRRRGE